MVVPVAFGPALIQPYIGFLQHTVQRGETLSALARRFYDDARQFPRVFEANRHQINDPDLIFPGQVLRIPQ